MILTSGEKYLIDTNIILYALDKKSLLHSKVKAFFEATLRGEEKLVIAHQNILECIAVLTRGYKIPHDIALQEVLGFASVFEQIAPFPRTMDTFLFLTRRTKTLYVFDTYLVATMMDNGIERIITANPKDFRDVGLKEVITPD